MEDFIHITPNLCFSFISQEQIRSEEDQEHLMHPTLWLRLTFVSHFMMSCQIFIYTLFVAGKIFSLRTTHFPLNELCILAHPLNMRCKYSR